MPDMIPVANTVTPPNPQQSLGNLSSILGIRQQQQALQTGQYLQQSAQASAQQDQQKNRELQALSQFTINASKDPTYQNPDGSLNVQKFQQGANAVAPTYGQAYIGQATSNASQSIANRSALLGLTNEQRQTAGQIFGSLAADPTANHEKFLDAVEQAREVSNDPGYQRSVDAMLLHAPQTAGMPDAQVSQTFRQFARNAANATAAPDAGLSAPGPTTLVQGPSGQTPMNLNSASPTYGAVGKDVGLSLPQQIAFQAAGARASASGTGAAGIDTDRANMVSANIQPSNAGIQLSQSIDDLADQVYSGKVTDAISKAAAALGISPGTYARQLLKKDLGQLQTIATKSAPSDEARTTILSGYPEATSDPQTIHTAMDYLRGSLRQNVNRGQLLNSYQKQHPDNSGFQHADDALTSSMDPLMTEYKSLPAGAARQGFIRRNFKSAQEAQGFVDKVNGASHALGQ